MYIPPPRVHINSPRMYIPPTDQTNEPRMHIPPRMHINNPREEVGFNGCSDSQKSTIQESLADAAKLADWVEMYMNDRSSNA